MCKQARRTCLNLHCAGFAQTLPLIPCENRPRCETRVVRIPPDLRSTESYCPDCSAVTPRQRKSQYEKARRAAMARGSKVENEARKGKDDGAGAEKEEEEAQVGVGQEMMESSGMAECRGDIAGEDPGSADPVSTSASEEPDFLPAENSFVPSVQTRSEPPRDPQPTPPNQDPDVAPSPPPSPSPTLSGLITWFQADLAEMDIATRLTHILNCDPATGPPDAAPGPMAETPDCGAVGSDT